MTNDELFEEVWSPKEIFYSDGMNERLDKEMCRMFFDAGVNAALPQWRDIESYNIEIHGHTVMGWNPSWTMPNEVRWSSIQGRWLFSNTDDPATPTMFQPLPEPPKE